MARPTKLTGAVEEKILTAIRAGTSVYGSAQFAGVDRSTFHRWMERGDPKGKKRSDARFRDFRARVDEARGAAEVRDVTLIAKAAEGDWRAAAWRLERRAPERYGRGAVEEVLPDAPAEETERFDPRRLESEEMYEWRRFNRKARGRPTASEPIPRRRFGIEEDLRARRLAREQSDE